MFLFPGLTISTAVVHQDKFVEVFRGRSINDRCYGSQNHRTCFIGEDGDETDCRQVFGIGDVLTAEMVYTYSVF